MRFVHAAVLLIACQLCCGPAFAENRVALVIGNGVYAHARPLAYARDRSARIAEALKRQGFVIFGQRVQSDVTLAKMIDLVFEFGRAAREADKAIVYFSGYAVSESGANALVPADATFLGEGTVSSQTIRLDSLIAAIKPQFGHLTIVVDAAGSQTQSGALSSAKLVPMRNSESVTVRLAGEPENGGSASNTAGTLTATILDELQLAPDRVIGANPAGQAAGGTPIVSKPTEAELNKARLSIAKMSKSERASLMALASRQQKSPEDVLIGLRGSAVLGGSNNQDIVETKRIGASPAEEASAYNVEQVFYATDRKQKAPAASGLAYGADRGELVYGSCLVSVPFHHETGALEAPSILKGEFTQDPTKHVVLLKVEQQPEASFFSAIEKRIAGRPGRNAFIFVHGYNVSFEDAARRTAQMAYDLRFDGAAVFFSWPSQASFLRYPTDESNVDFGKVDFTQFVADFARKSGADNIYLIAHSMGNRALTGALEDLLDKNPEVKGKIREIILAAPDIDAEIFKRDIAPKIVGKGVQITLYASSNDWALYASKIFHGYARAGDTGREVVVEKDMTTIDASDVDTGLFGHAYFADSKSILADIYALLSGKLDPSQRAYLKPVRVQDGQYWKMSPAE